ncbi:MAG: DNA-directed RNA polymerase subunit delta [Bulleidia sp.]|nr:DNA-directed RNA polymerase subunit delta [Bulleidia sp.]
MSTKMTMADAAYTCMSKRKKEVEFAKLWQDVAKAMKIPDEQLARKKRQFYSELMMDNRFAALKGNKWDLRSRRTYDETHAKVESDIDDDSDASEVVREPLDIPGSTEAY